MSDGRLFTFPDEFTGIEVREWIDSVYQDESFVGWGFPLRFPGAADPGWLRRRRMRLLFLLGLPGPVYVELGAELALNERYSSDDPGGLSSEEWKEQLLRALDFRRGVGLFVAPRQVNWQGDDLHPEDRRGSSSGPGVVSYDLDHFQVIANVGSVPARLGDGSISIWSSDPVGTESLVSDNDDLPGDVTIWFSAK